MSVSDPYQLQRFLDAQDPIFERVMCELHSGLKESHWMWFVFPQLAALGQSPTSKYYGISCFEEAVSFHGHPLLFSRLTRSIEALMAWSGKRSAGQILGSVDAMKLHSSLTLFDQVEPSGLYERALLAFFDGSRDVATLALLKRRQ